MTEHEAEIEDTINQLILALARLKNLLVPQTKLASPPPTPLPPQPLRVFG